MFLFPYLFFPPSYWNTVLAISLYHCFISHIIETIPRKKFIFPVGNATGCLLFCRVFLSDDLSQNVEIQHPVSLRSFRGHAVTSWAFHLRIIYPDSG